MPSKQKKAFLFFCAAALGALLQCRPAAAATLESSDGAFTLEMPGDWQDAEASGDDVVLQAQKGVAEIKMRALPAALDEAGQRAKLQALQKKLKKGGIAPGKIYEVESESAGALQFVQFVSKGKRFQSGYFSLGGRSYSFLLTNLSTPEFKAVPATLAAAEAAEEQPAAPAAQPRQAPQPGQEAQPGQAPLAAEGQLAPPPAGQDGTLAAPPAGGFGETGAQPQGELPALPKRQVGGALYLFLLLALVSAAALGYRAFAGRNRQEEEQPVPAGGFSIHFQKRYLALHMTFDARDASGQEYLAVSPRWPSLLLGTGIILYFLLKVAVQGLSFAYLDLREAPTILLLVIVNLMSLANLLILVGAVLFAFFRTKMKLYGQDGALMLDICQKRLSFGSTYYFVRDAEGKEIGKIKRAGFVLIRRRWQLLDTQDGVLLDIREDSAARALARKFLGHLWGLLRTNYVVSDANSEIGEIRRDWSVWNRGRLQLLPPRGLHPALALAAALFVDVADPDRWHPWHS